MNIEYFSNPPALPALRSLGQGGSFIEGVEGEGIQICRVGLAPPIVIPAKAGIQMPYFTGEVIFAQIQKLPLALSAHNNPVCFRNIWLRSLF